MGGPRKCPDCGLEMALGHIPDRHTHGGMVPASWHEGAPVPRRFLGLDAGIELDRRKGKPITAWRCPGCGLLRLYAG